MSQRMLRLFVIALVPLTVLVGCKSNSAGAPRGLPADPSQNASDSASFETDCPQSNTTSFAKTKFALHAGAGFGAFHHWVYRPYRDGRFAKGSKGRFRTFAKAGLAALFVKRETRLALTDARANPMLCRAIAAPLANIGNSISNAYDRLKGGDPGGINSVNSSISTVESASSAQGDPIHENDNADITEMPS